LDSEVIKTITGSIDISMNGPRVWLAPVSSATGMDFSNLQTFGDLDMRLLASVALDPDELLMDRPYTVSSVMRTTVYFYRAGTEIYELTSPDGEAYVMQSMSQIVDPELTVDQLPNLGERLELPDGWSYAARVLDADLELATNGVATVVEDELQNTYQRR
ncbi:MAG: hypothetical protein AAFS10_01570, partial [Myxococcota bacterium]